MNNRIAILSLIAFSEGTSTHKLTKNNGYDVIVTGIDGRPEIFTDYSDHPFANGRPAKVFNKTGSRSSASGRYQQLYSFWPAYKKQLGLKDFGPASQDKLALQLIRECKALEDVDRGDVKTFTQKCSRIWASLPGSTYGQRVHPLAVLEAKFKELGGITL